MMPAPRPTSSSRECSKTRTSQPIRRSRLAAKSPPSEPPITSARRGFAPVMVVDESGLSVGLSFFGRQVQLDRDLARVFEENLMQAEPRHRALAIRDAVTRESLPYVGESGRRESHVVHGPGPVQRREIPIAQISLEAFRVLRVDADDVHNAV